MASTASRISTACTRAGMMTRCSSTLSTSWRLRATICAACRRKTKLKRLLARQPEGIFASDYEQGEIGPDLFLQACKFGLEGMVSKRRDRPYRSGGRSPDWIKVKNRSHPSLARVKEAFS
jgi:hypothetical protein